MKYTALQLLRIKDIMNIMDCTEYTAKKIRIEVAEHFSIPPKRITYEKFIDYFDAKQKKEAI